MRAAFLGVATALALGACADPSPAFVTDAGLDGASSDTASPPSDLALDAPCPVGARRCDPAAPDSRQECAADGSGWRTVEACDPAAGNHCVAGACRNPCEALGASYLGCDYWPVTLANGTLARRFAYAVVVSNPQPYPVGVRVEGGALTEPLRRTVAPGAVEAITLPWVPALSQNAGQCCAPPFNTEGRASCAARSTAARGGAYHLVADGPVAAYQFNPLEYRQGDDYSFTNDASLLLPQGTLGQSYLVFSYTNNGPPIGQPTDRCAVTGLRNGYVAVVGAQASGDNTVRVRSAVPLWNPADPARTLPPGAHTFTIARGEVLLLAAQGFGADLTGTAVDTSAPAAVYSGHECTSVPIDRPACDHLEEQLFPTTAWGDTYAVSPLRYRLGRFDPAVVRVMAQRDGVTLTFEGIAAPAACQRPLGRGQYCELTTAEGFTVRGGGPIAVAQYMMGLGDVPECMCSGTGCVDGPRCAGDPALVLEVPTAQYRNRYRFLTPATYTESFVNVVVPPGAQISLDGALLQGPGVPTGTGLETRVATLPPGAHEVYALDPQVRFGIKVYGVAPYTSYAYPGGLDLAPIAPP